MIKLQFIGTGGLEAPRIKNRLSRDYRRFPTLLIDEKIIIDPSFDIFEFEESFMLQGLFRTVEYAFVTHSHLDSFSIGAIERMARTDRLSVFLPEVLIPELSGIGAATHPAKPFSLIRIGDYGILPLPTNHRTEVPGEVALSFVIEKGGKTVLYAPDGAFINSEAWRILRELKLDAVILDCALGDGGYSADAVDHNNLALASAVRDIFISSGAATEGTKFILSHIPADKRRPLHDQLSAAAGELSMKVAYDGYLLVI